MTQLGEEGAKDRTESISPPLDVEAQKDLERGRTELPEVHSEPAQQQKKPDFTPLPRKQLVIVFVGLFLAVLMASLDQTIVATAIPAIVSDLGNLNDISWVFVAYLLTSTAFMPLYGKMGDIFGRTRVFVFAITTFMLGSLLCGVSTSMTFLIIARAIQGVGGGGLIALVMIIIADIVPIQDRGKYQGIIGATFAVSSVVGPLLGGVFVDHLSWTWLFFINLPIGILCIAVLIYGVKVTPFKLNLLKNVDYAGTLLIVAAVVCAVLAASWGGDKYAWDSAVVISLFVLAGVLFIIFVYVELKIASEPVMQFRLFKIRNVSVATFGSIFVGYPMFGAITYLPLYFQVVDEESATQSGVLMMPMMFGIIVGSMGSGIAVSKLGRYNFFPMVGLGMATLGLGLISTFEVTRNTGKEVGYLIILGLGIGLCLQPFLIAAQNAVEPRYIAVLTATINFFRTVGGVFGVTIFGTIFNSEMSVVSSNGSFSVESIKHLSPDELVEVKKHFVRAFNHMFVYAVPVAGVGFLIALFMKHIPLRGPPKPIKIAEKGNKPQAKQEEDTHGTMMVEM